MLRHYPLVFSVVIGLTIIPIVHADAAAEREVLARLLHELQAIDSLIGHAEAQRDKESRIRFQYDWLKQDLSRIKAGIQAHLEAPRTEPRTFPPLRGDYRR